MSQLSNYQIESSELRWMSITQLWDDIAVTASSSSLLPAAGGGEGGGEATASAANSNGFAGVSHIASLTLAAVYSVIGLLGLLGNALVIFVILHDAKMRRSVTNLLILNMAIADVNVMVLGLPEIAQFVSGSGWVLGLGACKILRFHMVVCLYVSVLSLAAVSIERYPSQ